MQANRIDCSEVLYWASHPFLHWHLLIFFPIKPLFPQTRTKWTVTFSDEAEASHSIWQSVNGKHDWTGGEILPLFYPQTKSQLSPEPPHASPPSYHSLLSLLPLFLPTFICLTTCEGSLWVGRWVQRKDWGMKSQALSGFCIFECTFNTA